MASQSQLYEKDLRRDQTHVTLADGWPLLHDPAALAHLLH